MKDAGSIINSPVALPAPPLALTNSKPSMESRRSFIHLVFSLSCMIALLYYGGNYLDQADSLEEKLKAAGLCLNAALIVLGCVFLPSPPYTGVIRYIAKFIQSIAFTYLINLIFAALLVNSLGPSHFEIRIDRNRSEPCQPNH